ncbi:uncharacterized protein TNCV_470181 [Trichonephila clavipes]|nr:uncharacterized protein TNCV_470181 [Trichonephila clavipes]
MVKREPEEEKGGVGTHHVTLVITVKKLDDCPRLRLVNLSTFRLGVLFPRPGHIIRGRISCSSECLNQMHKEEKNFVKEKLAASPVEKVTKKPQKNNANSSATAKSRSEYMREYQTRKKNNIAKYSLNTEFNDKHKNSANSSNATAKSPPEYT